MRITKRSQTMLSAPLLVGALSFTFPAYGTQIGAFENVTSDIGRGFGSSYNRYSWSMSGFNDDLYVGTWNSQIDVPEIVAGVLDGSISFGGGLGGDVLDLTGNFLDSKGGEIWRHRPSTGEWTQVFDAPTDSEIGYRKMIEHDGALFAGSVDYQNGGRILTSTDGVSWSQVAGGPASNPANKSIRAMHSHGGKLYVGTENDSEGAELWTWDGASWEMVEKFTDGSVAELNTHKGKLYVGTWNFDGLTDGKFQLYNSGNGTDFDNVTPVFPGSDALANVGVMQVQNIGGELVLTTVNYRDGFTLLKSNNAENPGDWQVVSVDGLGDPDNKYGWSSVVIDGVMYLGTFNAGIQGGQYAPLPIPLDGRGQIFQSTDGVNWDLVVDDGFDKFNYGIRTMTELDGKLYAGTASNMLAFDPFAYDWADFLDRHPDLALPDEIANQLPVDQDSILNMLANDQFEEIIAILSGISPEIGELLDLFDISLPLMGTQVWAAEVPEPGVVALMGLGLFGLMSARGRRKLS